MRCTALVIACSLANILLADSQVLLGDINGGYVYSIDPLTYTATATVMNGGGMNPFSEPAGISFSPDGSYYYVSTISSNGVFRGTGLTEVTQVTNDMMPGFQDVFGICISPTGNFAYAPDTSAQEIFIIDTATNTVTGAVTNGIMPSMNNVYTVSISNDGTFAYAADTVYGVFRIDIDSTTGNGASTHLVGVGDYPFINNPQCVWVSPDGTFAYVADTDASVYKIDTATNIPVETTVSSGPAFSSPQSVIVSPDGTRAYVADTGNNNVYSIDTASNTAIQLLSDPNINDGFPTSQLAISSDGQILYIPCGGGAGGVAPGASVIDLSNPGTLIPVVFPMSLPSPIYPSAFAVPAVPFVSSISLAGLTGNNLALARYLNQNAPASTRALFSSLQGSALTEALESASPARNLFSTFAVQTTQVALNRILADHAKYPFSYPQSSSMVAASTKTQEELLAGPLQPSSSNSRKASASHRLWGAGFGEYAREKEQNQTPSFTTSTGGAVAAWEMALSSQWIGLGAAWAYTHLHEKEGAGFSNVNQAELFFYGNFEASRWHFDAAVWGGYYYFNNVRTISFPGFFANGNLETHGWQLSPHLEIRYDYRQNWFSLQPFTLVDWANSWQQKGHESGANRLNMGQMGFYSCLLRSETGLYFEETLTYSWGTLSFLEKISYAYQKLFGTNLNAFLIGSPGSFTVSTLTGAQNLGVGEWAMLFTPKSNQYPYGSLSGHVELGSSYQSFQGTFTLGKQF